MKLAISSNDGRFDSPFSARFACCDAFIFVDTETRIWETIPNLVAEAHGGVGAVRETLETYLGGELREAAPCAESVAHGHGHGSRI